MNTILVELRLSSTDEYDEVNGHLVHFGIRYRDVMQTIDDLNDILVRMSMQLSMDILSVSHVPHVYEQEGTVSRIDYSTTCVFSHNGQTAESIVTFLKKNDQLHPWNDGGKVSVVISDLGPQIRMNRTRK